jgi:hypothetical protein
MLMKNKSRIISILITLVFFLNICIIGVGSAGPGPSVVLSLGPSHPPASLTSDVSVYSSGEPVMLNISLKNEGPGPVTILGVPPRMGINHMGGADIRTYQRTNSARVLRDGELYETVLIWDQKDEQGRQVDPGVYTIGVYSLYSPGDNGGIWDLSGAIQRTGTTKVLIESSGGFLQKNLSMVQTQLDNGVTATLVSVNCSAMKGTVSFNVEIPEKKIDVTPRPAGLIPCDVSAYPVASYRIDNGSARNFLDMNYICDTSPSQVHKVTMIFEPLPADAKTLEINVSKFGNHEGTWNYRIDFTTPASDQTGRDSTKPSPLPVAIPVVILVFAIIYTGYLKKMQ